MSKKNTISYTVGTSLDGNVEVVHNLHEMPTLTKRTKAGFSKTSTKSKQKPEKKGIHSKRN